MPKSAVEKIIRFFAQDIWQLSKEDLNRPKGLLLKPIRIVLLTIRGYVKDNCALQASALTFYTLLSIVPVVAMAFGIAKGFGLEQRLQSQLYLEFAGQEEVLSKVIDFANSLLENTKGGLIAGIGVVLLFWSAIKVLNHIENTLNHIWKVKARSFVRKFTDYLTILIISPLLVIVSSSANVFITTQVKAITGKLALLEAASPVIYTMLKLLPFGLIWLLFFMIYIIMPNTQVRILSALAAGVISGTIYQLTQGIYISAQVLVSKYNAIYGSFAALPLFLFWLQISWMIVLLGAEIAYAHQHVSHYTMATDYRKTSPDFRRRYALHILRLIIQRFQNGSPPMTIEQISKHLKAPFLLVEQLTEQLCDGGLISKVEGKKGNDPFSLQPARDIHTITIASVIEALDKRGKKHFPAENDPAFAAVSQAVDDVRKEMERSKANHLVKDL
ncbi:MAG: YhjD/YihY/BrkB family envelope integrity protein [Desulfobacteraceae bacterium]